MAKRVPRPRATGYSTDVSDEEGERVVPYLTLSRLDSPQRTHNLRAVFNAIRWLVRTGASLRRRLARDYERLAQTLAAHHYLAFVCLMLPKALPALLCA